MLFRSFMKNTEEISDSQSQALNRLGVSLDVVNFASKDSVKQAQEYGIELHDGQVLTEDMRTKLAMLGVEYDSSASLAGSHKEALAEMFEAMASGEATVEDSQAAMQIFGSRAGPEMLQALQSGTMGIDELMATLENSEGTVAAASDIFDKQLGERWELIQRKYLEPFMETIGVKLMDLLEFVLDKIDEWGPYIEAGFEFFQETIVPALNVFLEVAQNVFGIIGGLIDTLIGVFTGDWDKALSGAQQIWESVWGGIKAFIEGFDLVNIIKGVTDKVIDFIKGIPQEFVDIGKAMMDGMVEGVKNIASKPVEAVKDAAGAVVDGVKGWFGIKSPSTVFAEIGKNLMEGLAEGIEEGRDRKSVV